MSQIRDDLVQISRNNLYFIINGQDQDLVVIHVVKLIYWTNIASLLIVVTK